MSGPKSDLGCAVQQIVCEGGGLVTVDAIRTRDLAVLAADAWAGSPEASTLLEAVQFTLAKVRQAPQRRPMLCAACPRPVREGDRFAVAVLRGAAEDARQGVSMVICRRCSPTPGAIKAAAAVGVRRLSPDARLIEPTHQQGGRA